MFLVNSYQFGGVVPSIDPDAQAFLTAAAITDPTITSAIDTLVVQLKADGIWTKMKALYPFVGGTATTHKYNLKNPLDTDAAFRLTFSGGWTHSVNGVQGNLTNAFADTYLVPSTNLVTDNHVSIYLNTLFTTGLAPYNIGAYNSETQAMAIRAMGNFDNISRTYNYSAINIANTIGNTAGFWLNNIISSNHRQLRNNVLRSSATKTGTVPTQKVYLGALNFNGTANFFTNQRIALSTIGDNLTATEEGNLYTAVQAFQTTLSRQV
jgi:hypothetical protein